MKIFQRLCCLFLSIAMTLPLSISALALGTNEPGELSGRVLQLLIVNSEGCYLYTGEDAQIALACYNQGDLKTERSHLIPSTPVEVAETVRPANVNSDVTLEPNSLHYKYRFVPDSNNGKKSYGDPKIICDPVGNGTSIKQSMLISYEATASGSVNTSLSGGFLNSVEAEIGTQYTKTFSVNYDINVNVAPKKRVWLQYKPEYTKYSGEAQKYYKTRNSNRIVIEQKKKVDILEASQRYAPILGKTVPAGAYAWCEDNDYMNNKPPVVQK